jgi:hypothetical protein
MLFCFNKTDQKDATTAAFPASLQAQKLKNSSPQFDLPLLIFGPFLPGKNASYGAENAVHHINN